MEFQNIQKLAIVIAFIAFGFLLGSLLVENKKEPMTVEGLDLFTNIEARGTGTLISINEEEVAVAHDEETKHFPVTKEFRITIDPVSERKEHLKELTQEADSCNELQMEDIKLIKEKDYTGDLEEINTNVPIRFFLEFQKGDFWVDHIIITK